MNSVGIRILDKKNRIVTVKLSDILNEISNGHFLCWSILHFYGSGHLGNGNTIPKFINQINKSDNGLYISWSDLNSLANDLVEIIDILIIGCKNQKLLERYENDQDMYETCDITIEMVDSGYWEVFSKEKTLIDTLSKKFKEIIFLEPNFEK